MKGFKVVSAALFVSCLAVLGSSLTSLAGDPPDPSSYLPTVRQVLQYKNVTDDPRSWIDSPVDMKNVVPKALYEKLTYDVEAMKKAWAEIVGFKAPEVVGKIAPEIKPGKYSYKDLKKYPGLKKLMIPSDYDRIKPGGRPYVGNTPEFEIVPTRQLYYALPVAEATKRNQGKVKLDPAGYVTPESLTSIEGGGGFPFPRPSGKFKAQQVMWNWVYGRYAQWGMNFANRLAILGFTSRMKVDLNGNMDNHFGRLSGRVMMPPFGWYDQRAEKRKELIAGVWNFNSPRDIAGTVRTMINFLGQNQPDQNLMYIPSMRRVRKMSATDTQDPVMGQDTIYDDANLLWQKLTPAKYPYSYEVEEREYLIHVAYDGTTYLSTEDFAFHNCTMERRPIYRITMTQLDKNYVYAKREVYVDAETFIIVNLANYDQRGRLYRTNSTAWGFVPEMGMPSFFPGYGVYHDHIDLHSMFILSWQAPAFWDIREELGMAHCIKCGK